MHQNSSSKLQQALRLCCVTHPPAHAWSRYLNHLESLLQGGVTMLQMRAKNVSDDKKRLWGRDLRSLTYSYNIPLVINDDVFLAKELAADGVHLGSQDATPAFARSVLGVGAIVGWSVDSLASLSLLSEQPVDYITASAVFPSPHKYCHTLWGLDGVRAIVAQSHVPVTAIGGITLGSIPSLMACGIAGVAMIGALHNDTPYISAQACLASIAPYCSHDDKDAF
jgi:thiamine-phosphate pyrophosphorylase